MSTPLCGEMASESQRRRAQVAGGKVVQGAWTQSWVDGLAPSEMGTEAGWSLVPTQVYLDSGGAQGPRFLPAYCSDPALSSQVTKADLPPPHPRHSRWQNREGKRKCSVDSGSLGPDSHARESHPLTSSWADLGPQAPDAFTGGRVWAARWHCTLPTLVSVPRRKAWSRQVVSAPGQPQRLL